MLIFNRDFVMILILILLFISYTSLAFALPDNGIPYLIAPMETTNLSPLVNDPLQYKDDHLDIRSITDVKLPDNKNFKVIKRTKSGIILE